MQHHADIEWKYARCHLFMDYLKEGFTLPVPLNLLPTPVSTFYSLKKFIKNYQLSKTEKKIKNEIAENKKNQKSKVDNVNQVCLIVFLFKKEVV